MKFVKTVCAVLIYWLIGSSAAIANEFERYLERGSNDDNKQLIIKNLLGFWAVDKRYAGLEGIELIDEQHLVLPRREATLKEDHVSNSLQYLGQWKLLSSAALPVNASIFEQSRRYIAALEKEITQREEKYDSMRKEFAALAKDKKTDQGRKAILRIRLALDSEQRKLKRARSASNDLEKALKARAGTMYRAEATVTVHNIYNNNLNIVNKPSSLNVRKGRFTFLVIGKELHVTEDDFSTVLSKIDKDALSEDSAKKRQGQINTLYSGWHKLCENYSQDDALHKSGALDECRKMRDALLKLDVVQKAEADYKQTTQAETIAGELDKKGGGVLLGDIPGKPGHAVSSTFKFEPDTDYRKTYRELCSAWIRFREAPKGEPAFSTSQLTSMHIKLRDVRSNKGECTYRDMEIVIPPLTSEVQVTKIPEIKHDVQLRNPWNIQLNWSSPQEAIDKRISSCIRSAFSTLYVEPGKRLNRYYSQQDKQFAQNVSAVVRDVKVQSNGFCTFGSLIVDGKNIVVPIASKSTDALLSVDVKDAHSKKPARPLWSEQFKSVQPKPAQTKPAQTKSDNPPVSQTEVKTSDQSQQEQPANQTIDKNFYQCWSMNNGFKMRLSRSGEARNPVSKGRVSATASATEINITWPSFIDTLQVNESSGNFTGSNQFNMRFSAQRIGTGNNVVGEWKRNDGAILNFAANGTVVSAALKGSWKKGAHTGQYIIDWPVVDRGVLANNGKGLKTQNQFGHAEWFVSTGCP